MGIQTLRLGISASVVSLIACTVWFVATGQSSKVHQSAIEAQAKSVAAARAIANGVSVDEMTRRAYAGCNFEVDSRGNAGELFQKSLNQQEASVSRISCINSYIYGDGLMYDSMPDVLREWAIAILELLVIAGAVGVAAGVLHIGGTMAARSWWSWLGGT
jgi:hypothetical protein